MGTSIERYLNADEIAQTKKQIDVMARVNQGTAPAKFVFFAAFDGTNNDKDNLKLSGSPKINWGQTPIKYIKYIKY